MRRSTLVRLAVAAAGTLAVWLASASAADAAQARRQRHHARATARVCDARGAVARSEGFSRPVRRPIRRHTFALLQRTRVKPLVEDDAAIQAGAAIGDHDNRRLFADLEPIGLLSLSHSGLFSHGTVSRRSPRGPPSAST